MTTERVPVDQTARELIATKGLDRTLFVEAGAGTGKTQALVGRIVELVLSDRARLNDLAAITFTEAAAAELRDRVRTRFEETRASLAGDNSGGAKRRELCEQALLDLDGAAISTLHAFAYRMLSEHPTEVGVPPRVEVLDEVQSLLEAEKRWSRFLDELLSREDVEPLLLRAMHLKIRLHSKARAGTKYSLRQIAISFDQNWDRIIDFAAVESPVLEPLDWEPLLTELRELVTLRSECLDESDKLAQWLIDDFEPTIQRILQAETELERLRLLQVKISKPGSRGRAENWSGDVDEHKERLRTVSKHIEAFQETASTQVLRRLAIEVARFTLDSAHARAAEGRLEFHDLLVLARQLLRNHPHARAELRNRYALLLLDEFQDTDPIQIELAVLLASSIGNPDPDSTESVDLSDRAWSDIPIDPGCLFVVGDPKQSIYRFRRADLNLFLEAREALAEGGPVALVQNFRTVPSILTWINKIFGKIIGSADDTSEGLTPPIDYVALEAFREDGPRIDHRPTILGGEHEDPKVGADALRAAEARTVALAIAEIRSEPGRWQVYDEDEEQWRNPRLADIAILIPTRASLRFLQQELELVDVPSRADTGVLLYDQPEVRSVLAVLTAIVDPADQIAVVAALRSPLFACGDDDLYRWKSAHGSWDYRKVPPEVLGADHVVSRAMQTLHSWHGERWWLEPSELINRIFEERKAFALAFADNRPRDAWRRLRYLLDQARAFQEAKGGDLRDFLAWAALQGADGARAHEPTLPEADDDAVRIMTIHGAKGLEFPITVVSGMTTEHRARSGGVQVLWPDDGGEPQFKNGSKLGSTQFEELADLEGAMNADEKNRLLYVACTRARDHLLISGFHKADKPSHGKQIASLSQDLIGTVARLYEDPVMVPPSPPVQLAMPDTGDTVEARGEFVERRTALLDQQSRIRSLSATTIARRARDIRDADAAAADAVVDLTDDGLFDDGLPDDTAHGEAEDHEQPVWRRGRAGTAIGRAVHGVLQTLNFAEPGRCEALSRAEAHAESVPWAADQIAATVRQALSSPVLQSTLHAKRSFKELFVSMPLGDLVVEGYIDLLVETDAGLVVVDYKTDAVASEAEIDAKMEHYRLQGATYALAVAETTGQPIADCVFVFASPTQVVERRIDDLDDAMAQVRSIAETDDLVEPKAP